MIFLSTERGWKPKWASKGLPSTVMVGVWVPWLVQTCRFCAANLGSVLATKTHLRKTQAKGDSFHLR